MKPSQISKARRRIIFRSKYRLYFVIFVILLIFVPSLHRNYVEDLKLIPRNTDNVWAQAYWMAITPFAVVSRAFLTDTLWRMYSPTWKRSIWIEWYALDQSKVMTLWPTPTFDPEYRAKTSRLQLEFFDLKEPKIQSELNHGHRERISYGIYLCRKIERETKVKPYAMKPIWKEFATPPPDVKWTLSDVKVKTFDKLPEVLCP
jgi:hypothetical protein